MLAAAAAEARAPSSPDAEAGAEAVLGSDLTAVGPTSLAVADLDAGVRGAATPAAELDSADVVVTGTRTETRFADTPVAVEVIDRATLEASGGRTVADVLQTHGNVRVERSFNGATAALRGLDARHTLVLIDGQRIGGRVDGALDLDRFPVEHLERIEIARGAGSALYGADAVGGIIHLITRRGRQTLAADATLQGGSLGQRDVSGQVSGTLGRLNARLSAGHHQVGSYRLDSASEATSGSGQTTTSVGTQLRLDLGHRRRVITLGGEFTDRQREAVDAPPSGAVFDRTQQTRMINARLGFELRGDGGTDWRSHVFVNQHDDQLLNDQRRSTALDSSLTTALTLGGADSQVDVSLGHHRLSLGVEGLGERAESPRLSGGEGSRLRGAVYAQDQWTLGGAPGAAWGAETYAVLVLGARADADSRFGTFASPRVSLRIDPEPWLALQASAGLGFRAPEFSEMLLLFDNPSVGYRVEGTPDLGPEVSRSVDAAATVRPANGAELKVGGFFNHIDNLIQIVAGSPATPGAPQVFRYANLDRALTAGMELAARWARPAWWVGGTYTWTVARDLSAGRTLEGRPAHQVSGELGGREAHTGLNLSLRGTWNGTRPYYLSVEGDGDVTRQAPAYLALDVRAGWRVGEHIEVFGTAQNLVDGGDATWTPLPPRRFVAGLTGRY